MDENTLVRTKHSALQNRLMNDLWLKARDNAVGAQKYLLFKDHISRINRYMAWLDENDRDWSDIDLNAYRDHLLLSLAPASVASHISVIKSRYREVLTENEFLTELNQASVDHLIDFYGNATPADVRAISKTYLDRIENNLTEDKGKVRGIIKKQDRVDSANVWLTPDQVHEYLGQIDRSTLIGIRDSALISLALCTGLRREELCTLRIKDLFETQNDKPVLLVRQGKGCKQRTVPYGGMLWCRDIVQEWLDTRDHLTYENYVFSGISPHNNKVIERELPITTITIKRRVSLYKVKDCRTIRPHDLRRTYARNLYLSGMDIEKIRLNMGHSDAQTTRGYIGDLKIGDREPEGIYQNPFN